MTAQELRLKQQHRQDAAFRGATRLFAILVLALLAAIIGSLVYGAWPAITTYGLPFITTVEWNPVTSAYGGWDSIYGTLLTSFIALLIAVPVSFGIAVFLTELSPLWLRRPLGIAIELLAGVPSIIFGMWGLFVFAPWFADNIQPWLMDHVGTLPYIGWLFQGAPMGIGLFTASLILSVMVIPYITSVMRDVFEVTPPMLKESAYGLGATTWEVVWNVVIPYTKNGIIGGIMLGLGRALGETMAVTFVIGNAHRIPETLFDPTTSIAATLANEFAEAASEIHIASLIYLGLLLFLITFVVLVASKLMLMRLQRNEGAHS
ncbi:phosphate ABC transporter permease subunit PstC [Chitinilyticum litopenaei]|uniref:phosphate ABC transporter permease subunit PstC n=1 Tax=Chitinilyticum litopenaei TaxID=1121276 RepID=UPI00048D33AC|nr:phosphate ABC transporter permease subunit PstC [Chitinilyticum litopenaei]